MLKTAAITPRDTTIAGAFNVDVNVLAKAFVNASLKTPGVGLSFKSGSLEIVASNIPFFPEARIAEVSSVTGRSPRNLELRVGTKNKQIAVDHVSGALVRETILAAYVHCVCKIEHMIQTAKAQGVGLTTKMQYQMAQAERECDRIGAMKMVWYDCCESPMIMSPSGLSFRATDSYGAWEPIVTYTDELSSGLGAVVQAESGKVVAFYKSLYPSATTEMITDAMDTNGVLSWFSQKFKVVRIPASLNRMVLKPPLLKQIELASVTDATALCHAYLLRVVLRAIKPDQYTSLVNEFIGALKKKKMTVAASELLTGQEIFSWASKLALGIPEGTDLVQVLDGVYGWQEYARVNNLKAHLHPLHWVTPTLSAEGVLTGFDAAGKDLSFDVPAHMLAFVELMIARSSALKGLLAGWEHFVASVYSASFKDSVETADSYRMKSFRPMFASLGISSSMMPEDVIGVLV